MNYDKLNPFFQNLEVDYLYHLGFDSGQNLEQMFGDVEYVILTRSFNNADTIANEFTKKFYSIRDTDVRCKTIGKRERYHIHKIHNSLIVSHGIGVPSLLICLNEVVKLLWHAKVKSPKFFRVGPSGGLGVNPGQIVVGTEAVTNTLEAQFESIEFGQLHHYPTQFCHALTQDFINAINKNETASIVTGKIISGMGYYNGQARLNGAMPLSYTPEEQQQYLHKAYNQGVRSFDMEATGFAGFCNQLEISCCEINAVLVDRFLTDEIYISKQEQILHFKKAANLVIDYVINH